MTQATSLSSQSTPSSPYSFPLDTRDRILLDIGGVHYSTTLTTLRAVPHSYFDNMFNTELYGEPEKDPVTGRYFVDRNGHLFQYILDFLHCKADVAVKSSSFSGEEKAQRCNFTLPTNRELRRRVLVEANFFGLDMDRTTEVLERERRERRRLNLVLAQSATDDDLVEQQVLLNNDNKYNCHDSSSGDNVMMGDDSEEIECDLVYE